MKTSVSGLELRQDVVGDRRARAAYEKLASAVLGVAFDKDRLPFPWQPLAFFESSGRCVAGLEVGILPMVLDGVTVAAGAIRSAATDPAWRGRGLFRRLMESALSYCERHSPAATFLYTATPEIYARFDFRALAQHAIVGPAPASPRTQDWQGLDLASRDDRQLVGDLVGRRTPVSSRCTLIVDRSLFLANLTADEDLKLVYNSARDALVVFEQDDDQLTIVDVVTPCMLTLATIMGAIDRRAARVRCLFPTDQLDWTGDRIAEDTGLMIRGPVPSAMTQPFMFSPTSEF